MFKLAVADVMSPGVLACAANASPRAVAGIMVVHEIHAVVIADSPAVVCDLDLLRARANVDVAAAADIASPAATVGPHDPLISAARAMAETRRSHTLVLEPGSEHPVGVVSTLDIAAALAGRDPRAARTVRPRPARPAIGTSRLDRVRVAQAMHLGVVACPADVSLREVARVFVDRHVHCVAVAGTAPAAWQFISDMDLTRAAVDQDDIRPADLAGDATWIAEEATLDEAAAVMVREHTSHLLVGGRRNGPIGVLSTLDIVDVLAVE